MMVKKDNSDEVMDISDFIRKHFPCFLERPKRDEVLIQAENMARNGYYNNSLYAPTNIDFAINYGKHSEETFLKGLKRIKRY